MRKSFALILPTFFICFLLEAQETKQIDLGNLKTDTAFNCQSDLRDEWFKYWHLPRICDSENQLEIRFSAPYSFNGAQIISLSFDGVRWKSILRKYANSFNPQRVYLALLKPKISYDKIFDSLKLHGIFLLPDQNELPIQNYMVADGGYYSITFKAGSKFRSYTFNNPEAYAEFYKNVPELKQYMALLNIFLNFFTE